jgi:arsenite methyltransferase
MATGDKPERLPDHPEQIVGEVRNRYGRIASGEMSACCGSVPGWCSTTEEGVAVGIGYSPEDLAAIPDGANLGLGCGAPVPLLDLRPGETVLDLGAGAGVDVFLAARRVGPSGKVIGVDMTEEMIEKARQYAASSGFDQVEFRLGRLEHLPVESGTVDAVTSNCVINLVPDKGVVFREIARVLRPGGRLVVSDIVLDGTLPVAIARDVLSYVGCIAGAMKRETYFALLAEAGLGQLRIIRDVDYVESAGYAIPPEILQTLDEQQIAADSLKGIVRSITYSAQRL